MASIDKKEHIEFNGLDVYAVVDHDKGCRTLRNGDPGWPESWEVTDIELHFNGQPLPDVVQEELVAVWEEDIIEAFIEAAGGQEAPEDW
jgi:hypothetical protein